MPTLRMMPKVVTMTDAAAARVRSILDAHPGALGLRVGVKKGGCAGMEYTLAVAEEKAPHDEVVEHEGAVVLIEPTAIMYLLGTEMDFKTDKLGQQFVFNNPNQTGSCGCGESVSLTPAAEAQALAQQD
jgi:iron-sulfur cluster assembly protein